MSAINAHHQEEIAKFLKCFRSRMKTHLENIDAEFEDTRSDRLSSDEMYSQQEIKDVLQSLSFAVKANVRSELQDSINMMALLLRQIFSDSERKNLMLELDVAQVEDKDLLAQVEKLSVAEWAGVRSPSSSKKIGSVASSSQKQTQQEEEIRQALHTNKVQQEEHSKEIKRMNRQLQQANETIEELERKLEDAQQHLSQTSQFQSMKKMVTQKNTQLAELRRRLQRYEPDYDQEETKNVDDDD